MSVLRQKSSGRGMAAIAALACGLLAPHVAHASLSSGTSADRTLSWVTSKTKMAIPTPVTPDFSSIGSAYGSHLYRLPSGDALSIISSTIGSPKGGYDANNNFSLYTPDGSFANSRSVNGTGYVQASSQAGSGTANGVLDYSFAKPIDYFSALIDGPEAQYGDFTVELLRAGIVVLALDGNNTSVHFSNATSEFLNVTASVGSSFDELRVTSIATAQYGPMFVQVAGLTYQQVAGSVSDTVGDADVPESGRGIAMSGLGLLGVAGLSRRRYLVGRRRLGRLSTLAA